MIYSVYLLFLVHFIFPQENKQKGEVPMILTCSAFVEGGMIPAQYTCDGKNVSPPLSWEGVPENTQFFALICDDPDAPAGTWVHWVVYDIPAQVKHLEEAIPPANVTQDGSKQGLNDFRKIGYGGPCPPGGTHRYFFKLYALDAPSGLDAGKTKAELLAKIKGHILAEAQLYGKYTRKK